MLTVTLTGVDEVVAGLGELASKLPSITARALTFTAQDTKAQVVGWMPRLLDRPTKWTVNSLFVFPAEKEDLRAAVAFKKDGGSVPRSQLGQVDAPRAMRAQVYGGRRELKSSEKSLLSNNVTQKSRPFMIPMVGAKKDQYGNVPGSFITKVLYTGGLTNTKTINPKTATDTKFGQYFILYLQPSARQGAVGIFKNMGRNNPPLPVFLFSSSAVYKVRFPFEKISVAVADRQLLIRFMESIDVVAKKYGL